MGKAEKNQQRGGRGVKGDGEGGRELGKEATVYLPAETPAVPYVLFTSLRACL